MRIGVSGTHCTGKTTLVNNIISLNGNYQSEQEAYYQLVEHGSLEDAFELTIESLQEQRDFCLEIFS